MKVTLTVIANNPIEETHASHLNLPSKEYKEGKTFYTLSFNSIYEATTFLQQTNNHLLNHGFIGKSQHKENIKTIRYKHYLEYKTIVAEVVKTQL